MMHPKKSPSTPPGLTRKSTFAVVIDKEIAAANSMQELFVVKKSFEVAVVAKADIPAADTTSSS